MVSRLPALGSVIAEMGTLLATVGSALAKPVNPRAARGQFCWRSWSVVVAKVGRWLAVCIKDSENLGERSASRFVAGPACHLFRNRIEIENVARNVGAQDGIADGVQRHSCALLLREQRLLDLPALDHTAQHSRKPVWVEVLSVQIVLGAELCRCPGDILVAFPTHKKQDRDQWRRPKNGLKRINTLAVGRKGSSKTASIPHRASRSIASESRATRSSCSPVLLGPVSAVCTNSPSAELSETTSTVNARSLMITALAGLHWHQCDVIAFSHSVRHRT